MAVGRSYLVAAAVVKVVGMARSTETTSQVPNTIVATMGAIAHISLVPVAQTNTIIHSKHKGNPVTTILLA